MCIDQSNGQKTSKRRSDLRKSTCCFKLQDPKVVVSVLMKLAGGAPSLADDLNVDSFLKQARSYDEASSSPFGWYLR